MKFGTIMNNKNLRDIYEKIYSEDKDKFFTYKTIDITKEVVSELDWKGIDALEIGCGTGETAYFLASLGAKVTAIDYSENAIKEAKNRHSHENLDFRVGSFENIDRSFDCIILQEVIEHTDEPFSVLRLLKEHVKDDGHIIITCPSFLNIRGIVWMTLQILFDVPMSLTDKYFITPSQMEECAKKLGLSLKWRTFRHSQAHGESMFTDMEKRLRNALRDAQLDNSKVSDLLKWLKEVCLYEKNAIHNGAIALYHFKK